MAIANLYSGSLAFPTSTTNMLSAISNATATTTATYTQFSYQIDGRVFLKATAATQAVPAFDSNTLSLFSLVPLLSSGSGATLVGQASVYVFAVNAAFTGNLAAGMAVTGTNIAPNTTISSVSAGASITLSANPTGNVNAIVVNGNTYAVLGTSASATVTVNAVGVFQGTVVPVDQTGNLVVNRPSFPQIPAGWAPFGYIVVVNNSGSNWTFGTNNWSAIGSSNGSNIFVDSVAYLPERPQNF